MNNKYTVVFFPTFGHRSANGVHWEIHIHGWIYHSKISSRLRGALLAWLRKRTEVKHTESAAELLNERLRPFLVRNLKGSQLEISIGNNTLLLPKSQKNGHFNHSFVCETDRLNNVCDVGWLPFYMDVPANPFRIEWPENRPRRVLGRVQLIEPTGVSVISDIDDTIKITNVAKRRELLANTFTRQFEPFDHLAKVYQQWFDKGARFHYVSASPWQLYQPLEEYLSETGFPDGSMHLQVFRLKDKIGLRKFKASGKAKLQAIRNILLAFPQRSFILVGDSGERDPELYGELKREFPHQITHIYIRTTMAGNNSPLRWDAAFEGVDPTTWRLFHDAAELQDEPIAI